MWIRLLKAHAVFFPSTIDPAGSVHSIGDPNGRALCQAGIAEPAAAPLCAAEPAHRLAAAATTTPSAVTSRAKAKAVLASAYAARQAKRVAGVKRVAGAKAQALADAMARARPATCSV